MTNKISKWTIHIVLSHNKEKHIEGSNIYEWKYKTYYNNDIAILSQYYSSIKVVDFLAYNMLSSM